MTDPKVAALATAIERAAGQCDPDTGADEWAAAILAALPPDWCGHVPEIVEAAHQLIRADAAGLAAEAEIARLRAALEFAIAGLNDPEVLGPEAKVRAIAALAPEAER